MAKPGTPARTLLDRIGGVAFAEEVGAAVQSAAPRLVRLELASPAGNGAGHLAVALTDDLTFWVEWWKVPKKDEAEIVAEEEHATADRVRRAVRTALGMDPDGPQELAEVPLGRGFPLSMYTWKDR